MQGVSCLKDAGFLSAPAPQSGLGYDPLQHWSPPKRTTVPPTSGEPSLGRKARSVFGTTPWEEERPDGSCVSGPPRGFPGDALRLPPVGDPSRAAACFANKVFSAGYYPFSSSSSSTRRRRSPPAANGPKLGDEGSALRQPRSSAGGVGVGVGVGMGVGMGGGGHRAGQAAVSGGRGAGKRREKVEVPKVFTLSARDVRVEFPYQASGCPGDMEHGDVIRWLRRFRGSSRAYERAAGMTHGLAVGVFTKVSSGEVADGVGAAEKPAQVLPGVRSLGYNSVPVSAASGGQASEAAAAAGSGLSLDNNRALPWACQYVEAREFDLSVAVVRTGNGDDIGGGGGGVLPDLSCAISGVSVSTAGYAPNGGGKGCFVGKCRGGGRRRNRSSGLGAKRQETEEPSSSSSSAVPLNVPSRSRSGGNAPEGERCGALFPGSPQGRGRGRGVGTTSGSSARVSVTLGGTRHCPNSRKRWLCLCLCFRGAAGLGPTVCVARQKVQVKHLHASYLIRRLRQGSSYTAVIRFRQARSGPRKKFVSPAVLERLCAI